MNLSAITAMMSGNPGAVFLDRDGTVSEESGYMYDVGLYRIFPWTGRAIRRLNDSGLKVVLVTNQSGVGRGYFTERMIDRVHDRLRRELDRSGAHLDAAYFCPHLPDAGCDCRKPRAGMLFRASDALGIDLRQSYMVGDRYLDIETGRAAGVRTILVLSGDGRQEREIHRNAELQPDYFAEDLEHAVDLILENR